MNIGWISAWSALRIRSTPFGPTNCQPSSAEIILSTLSPSAFCDRVADHQRDVEAVGREEVRRMARVLPSSA